MQRRFVGCCCRADVCPETVAAAGRLLFAVTTVETVVVVPLTKNTPPADETIALGRFPPPFSFGAEFLTAAAAAFAVTAEGGVPSESDVVALVQAPSFVAEDPSSSSSVSE